MECTTLWDGFERPLLVVDAPDDATDLYVVSQAGAIWRYGPDGVGQSPWLDLRDRVATCHLEQGLLGLAFSPNWPEDGTAYVSYTEKASCSKRGTSGKGDLIIASISATAAKAKVESLSELLRVKEPYRNHNGGHLTFGPDGMLYIGVGDGGDHGDPLKTGQDPTDHLGSILRIHVDATIGDGYWIPEDNPFIDGEGGAPEVWIYGLRNPWRFSFDADAVWVADVGQSCFEEVNRLPLESAAGANLGWSKREGMSSYNADGCPEVLVGPTGDLVDPIHAYNHLEGDCSITGGFVVSEAAWPEAAGAYLFADFCTGNLWGAWYDDGDVRVERLLETGLQVTSINQDAAGNIYLTHWAGSLHRLDRATTA